MIQEKSRLDILWEKQQSGSLSKEELLDLIEQIQNDKELNSKAPIDSPIFKGIPQVETSPDENDSSQRIPSTNWVNKKLEGVKIKLTSGEGIDYDETTQTISLTQDFIDKITNDWYFEE